MSLSVVVPARDAGETLAACVSALVKEAGEGTEIVVVDDASAEAVEETLGELVRSGTIRVVRLDARRGAAGARNAGARAARGELLFFVDADVVLAPGGIERARAALDDPAIDAVIGSYDDEPAAQTTVSLFKNLAHHHFHQRSGAEATTFWGACGAIRREAFEAAGGFDEKRFVAPSIEDVELGARLVAAGRRIRLDPGLRVRHLKRWTLRSLVATDVVRRAIPWTRLILERGGVPANLNFSADQRVATLIALGLVAVAVAGLFRPVALAGLLPGLAAAAWINRDLFALFARRGGARLLVAGFFLQQLYYLYSVAGLLAGVVLHVTGRSPRAA